VLLTVLPDYCAMCTYHPSTRSGYDGILGKYLEAQNTLEVMHFYQSTYRFQEAHFENDMERIAECNAIFDRYISRNADEPLSLPDNLRQSIVRHIIRCPQTIFTEANEWAIKQLCDVHWTAFKVNIACYVKGKYVADATTLRTVHVAYV
jgi:Regulator of G protein signaling domain